MKNREIEARVKTAFCHAAPDLLDSVLSHCEERKGSVIVLAEAKRRRPWVRRAAGIAAALALLVAGGLGLRYYSANVVVSSTVSLDVNPSVEIKTNRQERVLEVIPRNEDGQVIVGDMDFSGSGLDVTVNALIGSMLQNGYLSELANSILISVESDDPERGAALQERLTREINALLQTNTFTGAVLSQTVSPDEELQHTADSYGITMGKAQLIRQITRENSLYSFEDLVSLSINELNLLLESGKTGQVPVESLGTASDKAYIGEARAKELVLRHAGVASGDAVGLTAELDFEDGAMVYEVEFKAGGFEYDYDVDAATGEIRKSKKEADDDYRPPQASTEPTPSPSVQPTSAALIGEARAKELAFQHAGVSADGVTGLKVKLDRDDGVQVYEVEFRAGGWEYDYDIDAGTGAVLKADRDWDDDVRPSAAPTPAPTQAPAQTIGEARAKELAFQHAGVSADGVTGLKVKLDRDDGVQVYEVEFKAGGWEYDYDIDASTGAVLKADRDLDD